MELFYSETIRALDLPRDASILVVCGGEYDRDCLLECGFSNVTISNLDERISGNEFFPFTWSFQDVEELTFQDGSFDFVLVHAGLHHCASPHRGLTEMYRVARKAILAFEARDSLLMRVAVRAGRVPVYEACAVRAHNFRYGGVRNTAIPNFIYRWTEREIIKTISSYAPHAPHAVRFFYGLRVPVERIPFFNSRLLSPLALLIKAGIQTLFRIFKKQGNEFAIYVEKPSAHILHPWMKSSTSFDETYSGI
ncbi:MAG TPA: methyltransferase domain-containing protein [Acidobacteriaceae bacterium]